jgi:hypothetical protein
MFATVQWSELNEEEQKQFGRAFVEKALVDSTAASQLDQLMKDDEGDEETDYPSSRKYSQESLLFRE